MLVLARVASEWGARSAPCSPLDGDILERARDVGFWHFAPNWI